LGSDFYVGAVRIGLDADSGAWHQSKISSSAL